jgi:hypothetical protein
MENWANYNVHKSPLLQPNLLQLKPLHIASPYLKFISILCSHGKLGLPFGIFSLGFSAHVLHAFFIYSNRTTYSASSVFLDLRSLIIRKSYLLASIVNYTLVQIETYRKTMMIMYYKALHYVLISMIISTARMFPHALDIFHFSFNLPGSSFNYVLSFYFKFNRH